MSAMGFLKHATFAVDEAWLAPGSKPVKIARLADGSPGGNEVMHVSRLPRTAHRAEFNYTPRKGFLYVRSRAISSRTNDNHDHFPAEEIRLSYTSFIGKPVFVNHHNDNHKRARGVIIDAALHEDVNPDGSADTWCEVLMEVDAVRFPRLAQAILAGHIDRTSMGTDVEYSVCSVCSNRAETPLDYCEHIPRMKGMKFVRRNAATGRNEEITCYEKCYGLRFFENSLLVEDPADPTAYFLGVDDRGVDGGYTGTLRAASKVAAVEWVNESSIFGNNWTAEVNGYHLSAGRVMIGGSSIEEYPFSWFVAVGEGFDAHEIEQGATQTLAEAKQAAEQYAMSHRAASKTASVRGFQCKDGSGWQGSLCGPCFRQSPGLEVVYPITTESHGDGSHVYVCENCGKNIVRYTQGSRENSPPAAVKARDYVNNAVRDGRMEKPDKCSNGGCKSGLPPTFHHTDYRSKDVGRWLCSPCHERADLRHGSMEKQATKAYIGAKMEYVQGPGISKNQVFRISWNTSPNPVDWGGPVEFPAPWDPEQATALVTTAGLTNVSEWEWMPNVAMYRATADWDHQTVGSRKEAFVLTERNAMTITATKHEALGETIAPAEIDTLRDEECPVCGEKDTYNGERCMVCQFVKPPDVFMDPDLEVAKQVNLRQDADEDEENVVGADLRCDNCGATFDSKDEPGGADPADAANGADPKKPGVQDARVDKAKAPAAGGGVQQFRVSKIDPFERKQEGEDLGKAQFELKGADDDKPEDVPDTAPKAGDTCPNCGQGTLQSVAPGEGDPVEPPVDPGQQEKDVAPTEEQAPGEQAPVADDKADDDQQDDDDDEDPDDDKPEGPPWLKKKKKAPTPAQKSQKETSMRPALAALAEQQKQIQSQTSRQSVTDRALLALGSIAGLDQHPAFVALRRQADIENPANPVPTPPAEAPAATTEETLGDLNGDSVTTPGSTSVTDVSPDGTDSVLSPGTSLDTTLDLNEQDVTAPVAGTEGPQPLADVKTETDVRVGDPMKTDQMFPLQGPFAATPTTGASRGGEARPIAAMRLARLRITCGVEQVDDDLVLAQSITSSTATDAEIQQEIATLAKVYAANRSQGRVASQTARSLVPQQAQRVARTMPSLADQQPVGVGVTASMAPGDDEFLFD